MKEPTAFERMQRLTGAIASVPKAEIEAKTRAYERKRKKKTARKRKSS